VRSEKQAQFYPAARSSLARISGLLCQKLTARYLARNEFANELKIVKNPWVSCGAASESVPRLAVCIRDGLDRQSPSD
jgi:hypothetical protein